MSDTQRMGNDGFYWFMGVVECANDPEKLGRVKVRVLGDHTQDKSDIPSEDLPWAMPMMPVTTASMNGIGEAPVGLLKGSWVVGFYRDGSDKQQPIIMGSIGGIPLDAANGEIGFNDPSECFPQESKLEEPDTGRNARGVSGNYAVEPMNVTIRKASVMGTITTPTTNWAEPASPYAAVYPYNRTWEGPYNPTCDGAEWGHVEEWDSTPGAERYLRWHKTSQNFLEIHPDGKEVRKIYGDGFELDLGTKHLYVNGDYKVTVKGNKEESIQGDLIQHVSGDFVRVVEGNKVTRTDGFDSAVTVANRYRFQKGESVHLNEKNLLMKTNEEINIIAGTNFNQFAMEKIATGIVEDENIHISVPGRVTGSDIDYPLATLKSATMEAMSNTIGLSTAGDNSSKTSITVKQLPDLPAREIISLTLTKARMEMTEFSMDIEYETLNIHSPLVLFAGEVLMGGILSVGISVYCGGVVFAKAFTVSTIPIEVEILPLEPIELEKDFFMLGKTFEKTVTSTTPVVPGDIHNC